VLFEDVDHLLRQSDGPAALPGLGLTVLADRAPHRDVRRGPVLRLQENVIPGKGPRLFRHREVLALSGWLALLIGCVEYDTGARHAAESTRQAALSLATEADHAEVAGWAHEMRAWFALTTGDYRGVIAAAQAGAERAQHHGVAVQLAGQEAKAWARIGDLRQVEVALDKRRRLLEGMPYPENLDNHFVVDPAKFDFYAMDCYRLVGEDKLARTLAEEVLRAGTDFDGTERSPMRKRGSASHARSHRGA
jgi:hypothetical protein